VGEKIARRGSAARLERTLYWAYYVDLRHQKFSRKTSGKDEKSKV